MVNFFKTTLLKDTKVQILVIVVITFLIYANSLSNKLLWDDHLFLEQWPEIQSFQHLGAILKGSAPPAQGKIYRPLRGIFYMIDYQLWGANPLGFRTQAVLIHILATILVYLIVMEFVRGFVGGQFHSLRNNFAAANQRGDPSAATPQRLLLMIPFITALLFGVHPIHTETIDYISTSMETIGTVFFFLAFYLYLLKDKVKKDLRLGVYLGSIFSATLAFFTYEMTLTLPFLLMLYEMCLRPSFRVSVSESRSYIKVALGFARTIKWIIPFFVGALIFISIRFAVLGLISRTEYLGYSFYLTQLTMVKVFVRYIGLILFPVNQTAIHNLVGDFPSSMISYDKLDPILNQTIFDPGVILSVSTISALILVAVRYIRKYPILSFSILWFFVSLLPVSYIIPHGGAMAEKYLYIPSFGVLLLISYFLVNLYQSYILKFSRNRHSLVFLRQLLIFGFIGLIVILSGLTIARNTVWKDDISLFSDVVKKSPDNLLANYTLGVWFGNFNQLQEAEAHYSKVLDKAPDFWQAHVNLANIYLRSVQFDKAAEEYRKSLNINTGLKLASNSLKNMSLLKSASDSAKVYGNDVFARFKGQNGLEFFFPSFWSIEDVDSQVKLKDSDELFTVEIETISKDIKTPVNDFLEKQASPSGTLVNQGLARIPQFGSAYVKVFDDKGVVKLQFFLIQNEKVVKVLVSPANSPQMRLFDSILGSLKIN